ncbi:MAG: cryptochrome/photolyase family protein [Rickettsiales bacterium]
MTSLVWLRRDLRLHDHAALATALAQKQPVQLAFVFDTEILARFTNKNDRRLTFIAETLCHIDAQLQKRGGRVLVFHGKATDIIPRLATGLQSETVFSAEDFEPFTRERDATVKTSLTPRVRFVQVLDHLILAPQAMLKGDKTPYKVFTPFYKLWRNGLGPSEWAEYEVKDKGRYADAQDNAKAARTAGLPPLNLDSPAGLLKQIGYEYKKDTLWTVDNAQERLKKFIRERLTDYPTARDELPIIGTSQLSPYLRFGQISVRECLRAAIDAGNGEKWISELAWREFYASILFHFPEVVTQEFMPQYRGDAIPWNYDKKLLDAFTTGMTGYPVIDAAVRELLETGTMHNRSRMIVASFASKDLLLDWRAGEEFFAQHLMDYELASNNGGWQWSSSVGTDASPYFRIFNPVLQSRKFDPNGEYIRQYVPELREMSPKHIHDPWLSAYKPKTYPAPIVDHAAAKERAIAVFKQVGKRMAG